MSLEIFVLFIAFANIAVVLEFVRRRKLAESFALLWSCVAVGGILLVLLRPLIDRFSHFVGVEAGTSVVFALGILFLIVVSMYLSVHITALEDKVEALAEELAMIRGVRVPPATDAPPTSFGEGGRRSGPADRPAEGSGDGEGIASDRIDPEA